MKTRNDCLARRLSVVFRMIVALLLAVSPSASPVGAYPLRHDAPLSSQISSAHGAALDPLMHFPTLPSTLSRTASTPGLNPPPIQQSGNIDQLTKSQVGMHITATSPAHPEVGVPLTTTLSATFDALVDGGTVGPQTFIANGLMGGTLTGILTTDNNGVRLTPARALFPGEVVRTTATANIHNLSGDSLTPYQWQFTAGKISERCVAGFVQAPITLTGVYGSSVAWGDYDQDGNLDILLAGYTGSASATQVWHNEGNGTFTQMPTTLTGLHNAVVDWGDYDHDGDLDILLNGESNISRVTEIWRNDGGSVFTKLATTLTGVYGGVVAWADYDNDGDLDVLLTGVNNSGALTTEVWRNNGNDTFSQIATTMSGLFSSAAAWGDYDNDGDVDLLLAGSLGFTSTMQLWRNDGTDLFTQMPAALTNISNGTVAWGDYDRDGDLDILLAGLSGTTRVTEVWRNDGGGAFSKLATAITGIYNRTAAWGDYDNDGRLDILIAGMKTGSVAVTEVWRNTGNDTFTQLPVTLTGVYGSWVAWGDYDNDGDLDILLAGTTGSNQALTQIWRNDDCPPDLSIAKAVTPTTVLPGQPITYTLAFSYTGPGLATGVLIADQLPAFIATTSVASSGVVLTPTGSASYAWQVQDLTSGQGGVITLTGIVSPGLQGLTGFSNTATITGTTTELNTANNSSSANVTLHYALDIRTIGGGAVTRNPNQIDYAYGEVITLTAQA